MIFGNREEAAHLLAENLVKYRGQNPLVLAIPRGAVGMAEVIAWSFRRTRLPEASYRTAEEK